MLKFVIDYLQIEENDNIEWKLKFVSCKVTSQNLIYIFISSFVSSKIYFKQLQKARMTSKYNFRQLMLVLTVSDLKLEFQLT